MKKETTTRERILDGALRIFSMKGYVGATTREIAGEAGVAEVTLFRHFASKERLFEEVVSRYSFLPELKGLLPALRDRDYRDALFLIAERFLGILKERRELVRIVQAEMHRLPRIREIFYLFTDDQFRTLASYFREIKGKGLFRDLDPDYAARAFLGMFFAYFYRQEFIAGKRMGKRERDRVVKEFIDIFVWGTLNETGRIRPGSKGRTY
jgi:AcrR family transcriptional regulator